VRTQKSLLRFLETGDVGHQPIPFMQHVFPLPPLPYCASARSLIKSLPLVDKKLVVHLSDEKATSDDTATSDHGGNADPAPALAASAAAADEPAAAQPAARADAEADESVSDAAAGAAAAPDERAVLARTASEGMKAATMAGDLLDDGSDDVMARANSDKDSDKDVPGETRGWRRRERREGGGGRRER
jgi:hypothetical protein